MKIKEIIEKINELHNKKIEIEGYMYVTKPFSYMCVDENLEGKDHEYVLILDNRIVEYLDLVRVPSFVGTPMLYSGWTRLVGVVYFNWAFPMFSAVVRSVSEISFTYSEYDKDAKETLQEIHKKFCGPYKNLYLIGGRPLSIKQTQAIKSLLKGNNSLLAIKEKFSKAEKHLLACSLSENVFEQFELKLLEVELEYCWEYSDNDLDTHLDTHIYR